MSVNLALQTHPAYTELRQLIAELSLISHSPIRSYDGKVRRDSGEDIGGRRPSGSDHEPRPRKPPADAKPEVWQHYEDELAAWTACYQRRNPDYFARALERCETEHRLKALRDEAKETLEAWQRTPIPAGQEPQYGTPQWKRYIAESKQDCGELARKFGVTRQYIHKVRRAYG